VSGRKNKAIAGKIGKFKVGVKGVFVPELRLMHKFKGQTCFIGNRFLSVVSLLEECDEKQ
jgi:hypothetical protein